MCFTLTCRGSVNTGATGAIAPIDFWKYQIAPFNFEDGQGKNHEINLDLYFYGSSYNIIQIASKYW